MTDDSCKCIIKRDKHSATVTVNGLEMVLVRMGSDFFMQML